MIDAEKFAADWIAAWNAHDLEAILSHYADDIVFRSPRIRLVLGQDISELRGKAALDDYWRRALALAPTLMFTIEGVTAGDGVVSIAYRNHRRQHAVETMVVNEAGLVAQGFATYRNGAPLDSMVRGINHITLAVRTLERSINFYRDVLGCRLVAQSPRGAYLEAGTLWLALHADKDRSEGPRSDYTHVAFDVDQKDFAALASRLRAAAVLWQDNTSEGDSLYFLDPDGHKLEIHVGSLKTRLANPFPGLKVVPSSVPAT